MTNRSARRFRLSLAIALAACAACDGSPPRPNVLIVSFDTLRADHLGCYGYERDTSPELDRFAAGALRYARAYAPAPWTLPSHAALLSGRHPHEIGIRHYESVLPADVELLAEILSRAGYQSAGFVDSSEGGYVGARRGFGRGFDTFEHAPFGERTPYRYDMKATVERAGEWLARRDTGRPFFLFLHTKSVHTAPADRELLAESDAPYHKPEAYRTRFLPEGRMRFSWTDEEGNGGVHFLKATNARIGAGAFDRSSFSPDRVEELIGLYDGGIFYTDEQLGRLLRRLAELGLDDDTLVVLTADHGEAFLEHDLLLHKEVYEPLLRVPLVVRLPARVARRDVIRTPVSLSDVAPTVLQQAGLPIPPAMTGRALPRVAAEPEEDRPFFSAYDHDEGHFYRAAGLREGRWKLVVKWLGADAPPAVELYDLRRDPEERHPVEDQPARREEMMQRALAWHVAQGGVHDERLELDAEARGELRALGYLR